VTTVSLSLFTQLEAWSTTSRQPKHLNSTSRQSEPIQQPRDVVGTREASRLTTHHRAVQRTRPSGRATSSLQRHHRATLALTIEPTQRTTRSTPPVAGTKQQ
ncbi:hypothetical protein SOVF_084650, partial [Spinacia oleracea]